MASAEEYLRQDIGFILSSNLFQIALLKAEIDRLKEQVANGSASTNASQDHGRQASGREAAGGAGWRSDASVPG